VYTAEADVFYNVVKEVWENMG